jgi:hypothetical protein
VDTRDADKKAVANKALLSDSPTFICSVVAFISSSAAVKKNAHAAECVLKARLHWTMSARNWLFLHETSYPNVMLADSWHLL